MTYEIYDGDRGIVRAATPDEVAEIEQRAAAAQAQAVAAYEAAVQRHLDDTAYLYGYDSLISAITYADEPSVPAFQIEGQAFRAWRSTVWADCRDKLAQYQDGALPEPTVADLIANLPALDLPPPTLGRSVQ